MDVATVAAHLSKMPLQDAAAAAVHCFGKAAAAALLKSHSDMRPEVAAAVCPAEGSGPAAKQVDMLFDAAAAAAAHSADSQSATAAN